MLAAETFFEERQELDTHYKEAFFTLYFEIENTEQIPISKVISLLADKKTTTNGRFMISIIW